MVQAGQEEAGKLTAENMEIRRQMATEKIVAEAICAFVQRLSAKLESLEPVVITLQQESTEARAAQVALEGKLHAQEQQLHAQQGTILELEPREEEMGEQLQCKNSSWWSSERSLWTRRPLGCRR